MLGLASLAQVTKEMSFLAQNEREVPDKELLDQYLARENNSPVFLASCESLIEKINNHFAKEVISRSTEYSLNAQGAGLTRLSSDLLWFIVENKQTLTQVNFNQNHFTVVPEKLLALPSLKTLHFEENYLSPTQISDLVASKRIDNIYVDNQIRPAIEFTTVRADPHLNRRKKRTSTIPPSLALPPAHMPATIPKTETETEKEVKDYTCTSEMLRKFIQTTKEIDLLSHHHKVSPEDKSELQILLSDKQDLRSSLQNRNEKLSKINDKLIEEAILKSSPLILLAQDCGITRFSNLLNNFVAKHKDTLQQINLQENCLTQVPRELLRLKQIENIDLSNNYLSVKELKQVFCEENEINVVCEPQLPLLESFQEILFSQSQTFTPLKEVNNKATPNAQRSIVIQQIVEPRRDNNSSRLI